MKTIDKPILVEQFFNTSVKELWDAITIPNKMRQWFFENMEDFKPEVGFKTQFAVQSGDQTFTHLWEVTEVIFNKKIILNWKYKEYPGNSSVTFEILEKQDNIVLKVTTIVLQDFPDGVPEFTRESCFEGWKYFINGKLKDYLEK